MSSLRDALARKDLSKTDKYLAILGHHVVPLPNAGIKSIAGENGWRDGAKSAPSSFLSKSDHCVLLPSGWELTGPGRRNLETRGIVPTIGVLTPVTIELERILLDVHNPQQSAFVEEAIGCARSKQYRAAIVLSWVGAVYLLYQHIVSYKLNEFQAEFHRRWSKKTKPSTIDEFSAIKEAVFISILEHIKVFTKAEAKELVSCLDRRNTAGHPNTHVFTEVAVGHHIETLIKAVYTRF